MSFPSNAIQTPYAANPGGNSAAGLARATLTPMRQIQAAIPQPGWLVQR
jgi:hypothetical protein